MNEEFTVDDERPGRGRQIAFGLALIAILLIGYWAWSWWTSSLPDRLRADMRMAVRETRWNDVDEVSRRLIELNPNDGDAWLRRGEAAELRHDHVGAARIFTDMPEEIPEKTQGLRALVDLQFGPLNSPLAAEQSLHRLLARDPASKLAHQKLIIFYAMTLQRRNLIGEARSAIERHADSAEAYTYLFLADSLHLPRAPKANRRWLTGEPDSELFAVAEAVSAATPPDRVGPRDDVAAGNEQELAALLERYPHNLELLAWHLEAAMERGDVASARTLIAQLPSEAADDNRCCRFAGWVDEQAGREDEALAKYRQAITLHPLDWKTRHVLADLLRRREQVEEADRLVQIVQTAEELRRALDDLSDAPAIPADLFRRLAEYARQCGDVHYAEALDRVRDEHKGPAPPVAP
jgi:tetratricopeptide (TPR) repeat protein